MLELGEQVKMIDVPCIPGAAFATDYMLRRAEQEMEQSGMG